MNRTLDPELTSGLTDWGEGWGAQIREVAVTEPDETNLIGIRVTGSEAVLALSLHGVARSTEDGEPFILDQESTRRIRDLLNIATARGAL